MTNRITHCIALVSATVLLAACGSSVKLDQPTAATPAARMAAPSAATPVTPSTPATTGGVPQSSVATVDLARGGAAGSAGAGGTSASPSAPGAIAARSSAASGAALMAAPSERVVFFDFDRFAIRDEFNFVLDGFAKYLSDNKDQRLVIEGHADERGSREYNLALGQKRAESVVKALALLGVDDKRLEAVSFGEERPAMQGSDDAAWAKNRRAELKDR